ncbi:superoxide dismutase family protein [Caulobacter sp. SSI4214]|jgi:Cu-Zn family superoxide dismutase|uniref:superoxide dismutase[Cu-Zn] n=1 Tax=Caulobacter sp. SSI4214 TaxID=2575739 RepID=UPI00143ACDD6|nr:superoxide dismutase family protein [Caulobacter sp. SSI4214]
MRKLTVTTALSLVALLAASPALAQTAATAAMKTSDGKDAGTVTVTEAPHGVLLKLELKGLTPGWHAVHFHEKGDCSAPDFKSAGAHVHTAATTVHGLLNPDANDAGDLPNVFAGADGSATAEAFSTLVSLKGAGGRPALLDADGSAIVVHANADDYKTQPIGGAGARAACGVLK